MLHAILPAALTGRTMSAATSRIPTTRIESATVTAASAAENDVERADRDAGDARALLVDDDAGERVGTAAATVASPTAPSAAMTTRSARVTVRIEPNRYWKRFDVHRSGRRDEHDPEGDARIEDERKRLVAGRSAARPQELDERSPPRTAATSAVSDGRDVEQDARRDAGECDMADPVSDERLPPLDEEEADRRREHSDDRAGASASRMNS